MHLFVFDLDSYLPGHVTELVFLIFLNLKFARKHFEDNLITDLSALVGPGPTKALDLGFIYFKIEYITSEQSNVFPVTLALSLSFAAIAVPGSVLHPAHSCSLSFLSRTVTFLLTT